MSISITLVLQLLQIQKLVFVCYALCNQSLVVSVNVLVKPEYFKLVAVWQLSHYLTNEVLVFRREAKVRLVHIHTSLVIK